MTVDPRLQQLQGKVPLEGDGSPEGVVVAKPGRLYVDLTGGAGSTLYVKESGTGDTGWAAK